MFSKVQRLVSSKQYRLLFLLGFIAIVILLLMLFSGLLVDTIKMASLPTKAKKSVACTNITFAPAVTYPVSGNPRSIASGDFNRDGWEDMVTANEFPDNLESSNPMARSQYPLGVSILFNDRSGNFRPPVSYGFVTPWGFKVGAFSITTADFNGDGWLDLSTAQPATGLTNTVILLNNGWGDPLNPGSFTPSVNYDAGDPYSVASGDFNRDNWPDLALGGHKIPILLNNARGGFITPHTWNNSVELAGSPALAVADFNSDDWPDLAATQYFSNSVSILLNDRRGGFGPASTYSVDAFPYSIATVDFNGDGWMDLASANVLSDTLSVLLNDGTGGLHPAIHYKVGDIPRSVVVGDFNGDEWPDLASADVGSDRVSVLLNDGSGNFKLATNAAVVSPHALAVGDFNADGRLDLASPGSMTDIVSVLFNTCSSSTPTPLTTP